MQQQLTIKTDLDPISPKFYSGQQFDQLLKTQQLYNLVKRSAISKLLSPQVISKGKLSKINRKVGKEYFTNQRAISLKTKKNIKLKVIQTNTLPDISENQINSPQSIDQKKLEREERTLPIIDSSINSPTQSKGWLLMNSPPNQLNDLSQTFAKIPLRTRSKLLSTSQVPEIHVAIAAQPSIMENLRQHLLVVMGYTYNNHYFSITREALKSYMIKHFDKDYIHKFLSFIQFPNFIDFQGFVKFCERFNKWRRDDFIFLFHYLIDEDNQGLISAKNIFSVFRKSQQYVCLEQDYQILSKQLLQMKQTDQAKLESLYKLKRFTYQDFLIITNREAQVFIPTKAKKITIYHEGYFSLDHSEIRRYVQAQRSKEESQTSSQASTYSTQNKVKKRLPSIQLNGKLNLFEIVSGKQIKMNYQTLLNLYQDIRLPNLIYALMNVFCLYTVPTND